MLLFVSLQAQRRGTTKFLSSPDEVPEWDSFKTAPDSISRADIVSDGAQSRRAARYRTTTEKSTASAASDDGDIEVVKTSAKVPVYRVRGRNRAGKQITENEKNAADATTAKSIGESSNRTVRRKSYQSNKHRIGTRNENQSSETANKDTVSSTTTTTTTAHHATQTISSRKNPSESSIKTASTELPANHQPENHRKTFGDSASTRKTPTGRRYRIRVVEANSINANSPTSESEKKVASSTSATGDLKSTLKAKKPDRDAGIDDEQNYPEHFKALLKSKKSTVPPSLSSGSSRTNNFLPKKPATSKTSATTEPTSTVRTAYKHKKIERPNLKLLFPSLQKSSTTTTESTTLIEGDPTETDEISTETATPVPDATTTAKIKAAVNKQVGGAKFSSKIRTENDDPPSITPFRSRSTPLVFDTLKSSTQRNSDGPPTNHRFSSVSFQSKKNCNHIHCFHKF